MTPVFQTIIDKGNGNCLQAAVATLFDKQLNEVPHFLEFNEEWFHKLIEFYKDHGYKLMCFNPQRDTTLVKEVLEYDGGVNGYWLGTVNSIYFGSDVQHAVVVDKDLNVVHDPNPNNVGHVYSREDIIAIDVCSDNWYISENGKLVKEDR